MDRTPGSGRTVSSHWRPPRKVGALDLLGLPRGKPYRTEERPERLTEIAPAAVHLIEIIAIPDSIENPVAGVQSESPQEVQQPTAAERRVVEHVSHVE